MEKGGIMDKGEVLRRKVGGIQSMGRRISLDRSRIPSPLGMKQALAGWQGTTRFRLRWFLSSNILYNFMKLNCHKSVT